MGFKKINKSKFEELRARLQKEDEAKEQKNSSFSDWQFRPSLIGGSTTYRVRILPNIHVNDGLNEPWLSTFAHMFFPRGSAKKTYQVCPKSLDENAPCPICEAAKALYARGDAVSEEKAGQIYKKKRFHVNVLVLEDPRPEETNQKGQVLVWEFGPKILEKLKHALQTLKLYFWDVNDGYDFIITMMKKGNQMNYDLSEFARGSTDLSETYDLDEISKKVHDLDKKVFSRDDEGNARAIRSYEDLLDIFEGRNVKDENTKDESSVGNTAGERRTRVRDSHGKDESGVEEAPDVPKNEDLEIEDTDSSDEPEPESVDEDSTIDVSGIDFDSESPF
jgi:hypothetical protein